MSQRPVIIFHVAYRLDPEAGTASGIRPVRMRRAFEAIGYDVREISGTHAERRDQIRELRQQVRAGLQVEFVYSEASTTPTGLGEKVTRATSLTRDIAFLRFCRREGIPVGIFYRDVYWRFPVYAENVGWPYRPVLRMFYRWDLWRYRRAGLRVYLPSMRMGRWVPFIKPERMRELPPGGDPHDLRTTPSDGRTRLFYVGGLGSYYGLHDTVREVAGRDDATFTICVPAAQWEDRKAEYTEIWGDNIKIVHGSGSDLDEFYAAADAGLIVVEPIEYRRFAAPVKLFEYVSRGRPIIASADTFAGDFVQENGFGWVVRYGSGELGEILTRLREDPQLLTDVAERVAAHRHQHTWEARARTVAEDLATDRPNQLTGKPA